MKSIENDIQVYFVSAIRLMENLRKANNDRSFDYRIMA